MPGIRLIVACTHPKKAARSSLLAAQFTEAFISFSFGPALAEALQRRMTDGCNRQNWRQKEK